MGSCTPALHSRQQCLLEPQCCKVQRRNHAVLGTGIGRSVRCDASVRVGVGVNSFVGA